jgi:spore maturation protein CgeB
VRVHLVSPVFHGYWKAIATSLEQRGHTVTTYTYDNHPSRAGRTWHQLRHELPRQVGLGDHRGLAVQHTSGAADSVTDASPEAVVVVKGDTLGEQFWHTLAGLPRVVWLYDEVRRTRWTPEALMRTGPVATYSALDDAAFRGRGIDSRYVPLAFDHRLQAPVRVVHNREVTFVGARYPAREAVLGHLHDAGVPVRAYGRDWSGHPVDRLRTWRLTAPTVPAERDVTRVTAYDVMAGSAATLNLHGDQDGFTMRTFEASGVGGLQIIDRADLGGLYEPGVELVTWTELDELVELCRRADADPAWNAAIRAAGRARTLAEHTFDHRVAALEDAWDTA